MKLSGSYQINLDKEKVWDALNDPEILKQSIPGCDEFIKNSDTNFSAKATNKIGPFNASFSGDIELQNLKPPHSYKITGSGNSPVGFAQGEADVKLEDSDGGTKLIYSVDAQVGGKIAQVGSRLIDMTAKKMADIFFGKFSELVSNKTKILKTKTVSDVRVPREKKSINKILIYSSLIAIIAIIAKAIGSKPTLTAIGEKIAAVKSMIEIESIIIPKANHIKTITAIIAQVAMPEPIKRLSIALAIPVIASVRE